MRAPNALASIVVWLFVGCLTYAWIEGDSENPERVAAERARDEAAAARMHVPYEQYRAAQGKTSEAMAACRVAVESLAKWGSSSDWLFGGMWNTDGKTIRITAHDVKFKNGFGAEAYVAYSCVYDLSAGTAEILSVDDY